MMQDFSVQVFLGISLDGKIAGIDGDLSWLEAVACDPPENTGYQTLMQACDLLVMGRVTYETVLSFGAWPYLGKDVVVLTQSKRTTQHGERFVRGSLTEVFTRLRAEGYHKIYLDGGSIVRAALALGLITELTLNHIPVIVGDGVALFDASLPMSQ